MLKLGSPDGPDRSSDADHASAFFEPVGDELSCWRRHSQFELARHSDDIDIFHDTDESVSIAALKDIADLEASGFRVAVDVKTYGLFEATVSDDLSSTAIQWMSETRLRFFPLVKDEQWGLRLHQSDLAVNKVLAAASRRKARDFADIVAISENMCPLGPW